MGMPRESGGMIFIPQPHQLAARDAILAARREGRPGFLLGDLTGLGKTLSVWAALAAMPEDEILVVCPKGGMPQWRRTMAMSGLSPKKVTLINYERTKSLFTPPPASTRRSARAKNNSPGTVSLSEAGRWWSSMRAIACVTHTRNRAWPAGNSPTEHRSRST